MKYPAEGNASDEISLKAAPAERRTDGESADLQDETRNRLRKALRPRQVRGIDEEDQLTPKQERLVHELMGDAYVACGRNQEALREFGNAEAADKLIELGNRALKRRDLKLAEEAYAEAKAELTFAQYREYAKSISDTDLDAAIAAYARAEAFDDIFVIADRTFTRDPVWSANIYWKYRERLAVNRLPAIADRVLLNGANESEALRRYEELYRRAEKPLQSPALVAFGDACSMRIDERSWGDAWIHLATRAYELAGATDRLVALGTRYAWQASGDVSPVIEHRLPAVITCFEAAGDRDRLTQLGGDLVNRGAVILASKCYDAAGISTPTGPLLSVSRSVGTPLVDRVAALNILTGRNDVSESSEDAVSPDELRSKLREYSEKLVGWLETQDEPRLQRDVIELSEHALWSVGGNEPLRRVAKLYDRHGYLLDAARVFDLVGDRDQARRLAEELLHRGDIGQATLAFERIGTEPAPVLARWVREHFEQGRFRRVLRSFSDAGISVPLEPALEGLRNVTHWSSLVEALDIYHELGVKPDRDVVESYGATQISSGCWAEARRVFSFLGEQVPADRVVESADRHLADGDLEVAEEGYEMVGARPTAEKLIQGANRAVALGNRAAALRALKRLARSEFV